MWTDGLYIEAYVPFIQPLQGHWFLRHGLGVEGALKWVWLHIRHILWKSQEDVWTIVKYPVLLFAGNRQILKCMLLWTQSSPGFSLCVANFISIILNYLLRKTVSKNFNLTNLSNWRPRPFQVPLPHWQCLWTPWPPWWEWRLAAGHSLWSWPLLGQVYIVSETDINYFKFDL